MKLFDDFTDACQEFADLCVDNEADILLGIGITAVVGAVIATGVVTTKFIRETDAAKEGIEEMKQDLLDTTAPMTEKEETGLEIKSYIKAARWYAIPTVLLGVGLVCIGKSHFELKEEVAGWAASYVALDTVFKTYRKRVIDDQGKEKDIEYRYGARKELIEEEYTDAKGKKKKRTKEELVLDNLDCSEFAKFFDDTCKGFREDAEYNLAYLTATQGNFNELLITRYGDGTHGPARVFLNEVYDALGINRTAKGNEYGWVYNPKEFAHSSINPIDFGIVKLSRPNRRFINGLEPIVLLDFNCERLIRDSKFLHRD